ncbi:DNA-binding protein [Lutibacter sp.]|uniref:DNA-binding protein n=1 Tax=Lutibacter sp. TaxID=1925666 RepID=UPI0035696646
MIEVSRVQLREIEIKLDETIKRLNKIQKNVFNSEIIDNADFIQLMQISSSTAKNWRNKGIIPYSQIENKIYYKIEDIQIMLDIHYRSF